MIVLIPWLLFIAFTLFMSVLWIYAIIDIARRQFSDSTTKLIWLLVVIFLYGIGTIVYLVFGRWQGKLS
jgi:Phospholipase_D-nuclease N-terminal